MWTYRQSTGFLTAPGGAVEGQGYSGHAQGVNNPAMEADPGIGPIPAGTWLIGPPRNPIDHLGPIAMPLTPLRFDPHGRSGFFMHGGNSADNESASHGCIVMGRATRQVVFASPDKQLRVIP